MSTRTVSLISSRNTPAQRAHFAIFVPSAIPDMGTVIHVVGTPMTGYQLEFKKNYQPRLSPEPYTIHQIGQVNVQHIGDPTTTTPSIDSTPIGALELAASQISAPRVSQNFLAPVNDITNRRCQEWTMDYVRHLVAMEYVSDDAINIVQSKRDPPSHGITLSPHKDPNE
ncbi:MAG: hypothetical protein Q9227_001422 [Pyrenula ochraceoflavens]